MRRDPAQLADRTFDLVVVGGGITGAFTAWDAALRGLRVALLERGDFGHATSSASSKVIHGGVRHLQQGDLRRVRESLVERTVFRRIAPHLVHPLPFLIPTYGHGLKGKEILSLGMAVYEALGFDQNRIRDPQKILPRFQTLSRSETLALEPDLPGRGLTGGIRYYECHMHNSERTTLAVVRSAAAAGAEVANYVKVVGLLRNGDRVEGVVARDLESGSEFTVRAPVVANVSGPWARLVLDRTLARAESYSLGLSKGCHIVTRSLTRSGALALATRHRNEALINRGGRHLFIIPWRGHALIGTTNVPYAGDPGAVRVTETDVRDFLEDINNAFPAARLERGDVRFAFAGLYPLVNKDIDPGRYQGAGQYQIHDHGRLDRIEGLFTVIGAKFTTARNLGRQTVDLVFRKLGRKPPRALTAEIPVAGGDIALFEEFLASVLSDRRHPLDPDVRRDMALSYGSEVDQVLALIDHDPALGERIAPERPVVGAEVVHAVREEAAMQLADVVFRRTGLGTVGHPGRAALEACAHLMASVLGWTEARRREEIEAVEEQFAITDDTVPAAPGEHAQRRHAGDGAPRARDPEQRDVKPRGNSQRQLSQPG